MYEFYILIKHGNFTYSDILKMPIFERKKFIDILLEENKAIKKKREREMNKRKK